MSGLASTLRRWSSSSTTDQAERLWFERHRQFCTAIPFPSEIEWRDQELTDQSQLSLYQFSESLALSAMDWYARKKAGKKRLSKSLRYASYTFFVAGAALPLVNIFSLKSQEGIKNVIFGVTAVNLGEVSAEIALVFLGIAGGLRLIDRLVGASTGWIRYSMTAMQIEQRLLNFRFDWHEALGGARLLAPEDLTGRLRRVGQVGQSDRPATLTLGQTLFELARDFCNDVVKLLRNETETWAGEFSESVTQFDKHLSGNPPLRPHGTP